MYVQFPILMLIFTFKDIYLGSNSLYFPIQQSIFIFPHRFTVFMLSNQQSQWYSTSDISITSSYFPGLRANFSFLQTNIMFSHSKTIILGLSGYISVYFKILTGIQQCIFQFYMEVFQFYRGFSWLITGLQLNILVINEDYALPETKNRSHK